ncbi:unnamed protein product [Lactuca saligna]|uniref:Uncharacterized protein n=1 Tax=Lactuca saligna TaxID=75948 RepID=A0AA36E9R0_LACSI|nr:unnamed protein product [Lactuca saligna]
MEIDGDTSALLFTMINYALINDTHSYWDIKTSKMASLLILIVLEQSPVSPIQPTASQTYHSLMFFDLASLHIHPCHHFIIYELPLSKDGTRNPQIRYIEGDAVSVMIPESNMDFNNLVRNNPKACDKFYPFIPLLGKAEKVYDYVIIPLFSIQVTCFPNSGFSIGTTNHHGLGDASKHFFEAWTSIARSGSNELFLANGTFPFYDRVINHPTLDEVYPKKAKVDTFSEKYQPRCFSGLSDNVRTMLALTSPWNPTTLEARPFH